MERVYLSIDPGAKRTGFALFKENGDIMGMGVIKGQDRFLDWLEQQVEEFEIITAVVEQYRNRGGSINYMSTMPTSRHIGAIERILRKKKIKTVFQDPSPALTIGLRFIGMASAYADGKHVDDEISAWAHGEYYLRQKRIKEKFHE